MSNEPRLGNVTAITNTTGPTIKFPSSFQGGAATAVLADSAVKNWKYGTIQSVMVEASTTADKILRILSADGTRVLHNLRIELTAGQPKVFTRLNWPVYEPWGVDFNATDATLSIGLVFQCEDYLSDATAT